MKPMTPRDRFAKKMGQAGLAKGLSASVPATEEKSTPKKKKVKIPNKKNKKGNMFGKSKDGDFKTAKNKPLPDAIAPKFGIGLGGK